MSVASTGFKEVLVSTGYFSVTFFLSVPANRDGAVIVRAANAGEVRAWFKEYMPKAKITDMRPCVAQFETGTKP